jgi:hypothetical protein
MGRLGGAMAERVMVQWSQRASIMPQARGGSVPFPQSRQFHMANLSFRIAGIAASWRASCFQYGKSRFIFRNEARKSLICNA